MIKYLDHRFDVSGVLKELRAHPELWNQHTLRTDRYNTPHSEVSDIWVRFNKWENFDGDGYKFTCEPHVSSWYPCIEFLPSVEKIVLDVMELVGGAELGGVLITKIPPGGEVKPHVDSGWHAEHYEKFAVQIIGGKDQAFCFESDELRPEDGDLYTFDNSKLHWVKNESDHDRITLIICIAR